MRLLLALALSTALMGCPLFRSELPPVQFKAVAGTPPQVAVESSEVKTYSVANAAALPASISLDSSKPAGSPDRVTLTSAQPAHLRVGELSVDNSRGLGGIDLGRIKNEIKVEAGKRGANAIVWVDEGPRNFLAVAVRLSEPGAAR